VQVAEEGLLPAREGERGHRGRDADVDADHADLGVGLEAARGVAAAREDHRHVTIARAVERGEGGVEGFLADDAEDGAEDLFFGDPHAGADVVEDGGAQEAAERRRDGETERRSGRGRTNPLRPRGRGHLPLWGKIGRNPLRRRRRRHLPLSEKGEGGRAAVEEAGGAVGEAGGNEGLDAVAGLGVDDGAHGGGWVVAGAGGDFGGGFLDFGDEPVGGVADEDGDGAGEAALAGVAEGGAEDAVDGRALVGVGHDDHEVLGAAHALGAFSGGGRGRVDVLRDLRRADEGDGADVVVGDEMVGDGGAARDEVEDAGGEAAPHSFVCEFDFADGGEGDFFGGFEDEGVAAGDRDGPHPEGDHDGEVEGGDADADAEGDAIDGGVQAHSHDAAGFVLGATKRGRDGDLGESAAYHEDGGGAGEFDAIDAAPDVAACFGEGLAVLADDGGGEFVEVGFEGLLVAEEVLAAVADGGGGPGGEGACGGGDGVVGGADGVEVHVGEGLRGGGVGDGVGGVGGRSGAAVDDVGDGEHGVESTGGEEPEEKRRIR